MGLAKVELNKIVIGPRKSWLMILMLAFGLVFLSVQAYGVYKIGFIHPSEFLLIFIFCDIFGFCILFYRLLDNLFKTTELFVTNESVNIKVKLLFEKVENIKMSDIEDIIFEIRKPIAGSTFIDSDFFNYGNYHVIVLSREKHIVIYKALIKSDAEMIVKFLKRE